MAREEHFVPQLYLSSFIDPLSKGLKDPYFWVVDLDLRLIKRRAPKNTAKLSGYYDFENGKSLEDHFAKIENRVKKPLRQLVDGEFQLTDEDRFYLAAYLGLQLTRVPTYRQAAEGAEYKLARKNICKILKNNDKGIEIMPPDNFRDYLIGISAQAAIEFWSPLFFSGHWMLIIPPDTVDFFTSDNPVALLTPYSKPVIDKQLQIWFPLSPRCGLLIHFQDSHGGLVEHVEADVATGFNNGVLAVARRYIFCSSSGQGNWALENRLKK